MNLATLLPCGKDKMKGKGFFVGQKIDEEGGGNS